MFGDFLGYFKKTSILSEHTCGYFLGNFCKHLTCFNSNILTHCFYHQSDLKFRRRNSARSNAKIIRY